MTRLPPPRRGPPRNLRIVSLLVKQLKKGAAVITFRIKSEGNAAIRAENGNFLRTE
jgi:hypothetical protein